MTPKRRGRPRLDEDSETVSVTLKMPAKVYDDVFRRARDERISVPEFIRHAIHEGNKPKPQS
jgi:hypothetical protein